MNGAKVKGPHAKSARLRKLYFKGSLTHTSYTAAKARTRCGPEHKNYRYYHGVSMCARYLDNRTGYAAWVEDLGFRPGPEWSVDRLDPYGHYSCGRCTDCAAHGWPANVVWSTKSGQAAHKRPRPGQGAATVHGPRARVMRHGAAGHVQILREVVRDRELVMA